MCTEYTLKVDVTHIIFVSLSLYMHIIIKFYTCTYSLGVETLWNFMREMNVTADAELEAKVRFIHVQYTVLLSLEYKLLLN